MPALTVGTLVDWLASLSTLPPTPPISWPAIMMGPYIHEMPDRLITVTLLPGLGYAMEGAVDQPTFQVRVRSDQNNQASGEILAQDIDFRILNAKFPVTLNFANDLVSIDTKVSLVTRAAGSPAPLGPPDQAFRYDYTCTYRAVIGV